MTSIAFPGLVFEWRFETKQCIARFEDGTVCYASPHETDSYHGHATEKSTGCINAYCWQHDIAHQIVAMMRGRRASLVLWNLAHDISVEGAACEREEQEAQAFQRAFFLR